MQRNRSDEYHKMKYLPIVPIGMFDVLDDSGIKDVFVLAQLMQNNKAYREYYESRRWNTVILDNAVYEEKKFIDFKLMLGMCADIEAEVVRVVSPENLDSGLLTAGLTNEAIGNFGVCGTGCGNTHWQMMMILHEMPNEMKAQYDLMKHIGVSYGISIFSNRKGFDRGALARFCNIDKCSYTHAFGLDNLLEIFNMRACGVFDSVDSSIAITAAVNDVDLRKVWQIRRDIPIGKQTRRVDLLETRFSKAVKLQALENISFLQELCKGEL